MGLASLLTSRSCRVKKLYRNLRVKRVVVDEAGGSHIGVAERIERDRGAFNGERLRTEVHFGDLSSACYGVGVEIDV